jgi:hypothetical protein
MGHLYDKHDTAIPHPAAKGDTLAKIAAKYKGKDDVPGDLDWKEIARYNWATDDEAAVTRALCERIGSAVSGATNAGASPETLDLDPAFGPTTPEPIRVPKIWKTAALALKKQHTVTVRRRTPASAVGITRLDKWFIPGHEDCEVDYRTSGEEAFADAVHFDVYASNYGKLKAWKDGLPEFEPLTGVPVYSADASGGAIRGWQGLSKCAEGALSPDGHPLNVAFSPYTVVLRYAKKGVHTDARIDLEPFWVRFDEGGKPIPGSCRVKWKIHNAELTHGLLQVAGRDGTVIYAKGLDAADLKDAGFDWDGKDSTGKFVEPAKMPYRVQVQAHTGIDIEDGLALAAMHTEVRLFVHSATHPEKKADYDPLTDRTSLDFSIADVYHKDKPLERSDGSLWTKFKLAEAGFHPGPVSDAAVNDHFTTALHEFQRSVPKGGGAGSAPFERMVVGDDNDDTKNALEHLQPRRKRPWFGKPAEPGATIELTWRPGNWPDTTAGDFLSRLRDPAKRMIAWVDDRNWYTDGEYWNDGFYDKTTLVSRDILKVIHDDPADLGGASAAGRGSFEDRDKRIDCDIRDVARPWIPLQVDIRLLSREQELDTEVATPGEDLATIMRKAIGPLRVDWTFDEIEKTSTVASVLENKAPVSHALPELDLESDVLFSKLYHPATVRGAVTRPRSVRTRTALRWALDKLKAEHDRKDVTRKSVYFNAPEAHAGIRPTDVASYFKRALAHEAESLAPWTAKPDDARQSICTAVHDDVGQGEDDVCARRLGRAGVYFHPSRIAGDGYQVRGQVRFDASGPYVSPNAAVLAGRYAKLPQAHTVQFRLWRKTTLRGFVKWSPIEDWSVARAGCFPNLPQTGPDQWRAHYTACHVCIENELGASDTELVQQINALLPDEDVYRDVVISTVDPMDARAALVNRGWISRTDTHVWPWSTHAQFGMTTPAAATEFNAAYAELYRKMMEGHVRVAIRMSLELVKAIERLTGRMRGHVLVQYRTSERLYYNQYRCPTCDESPVFVQNSDAMVMAGAPCPFQPCAGRLQPARYTVRYVCSNNHVSSFVEASSAGGAHLGEPCQDKSCTVNNSRQFRVDTKLVSVGPDSKRGSRPTPGVPSPSCGFPIGVFWNITGDANLWAHELGHNRHYEHSADAPSKSARPEHDDEVNDLLASTEKDADRGWDRACLMSYVTQVQDKTRTASYDNQRDIAAFCFKCVLKNRGWRVGGLQSPKGDLQDVAGV